MRLLIVDDEIFVIQGIMDGVNWDALGFSEVLQANCYSQAVAILEKQPVDIVLCDIEMPEANGLELIAWINDNQPDTECIILSCHDEFDFAKEAVRLNCMDYILKPVRYEFLTEILKKAMERVELNKRLHELESYGKIYINSLVQHKKEDSIDVVATVANYIEGHIAEDLSVKMLANMVYISPDHLTRSFKKKYHQTVSDYILDKRMRLASELLRDPRMTVTMVSDSVGFANYSYFTEQFKKYHGMTPREYQNKFRKL